MTNPHEFQDIRLPKAKRGHSRWITPLATGFAGLLLGFGIAGGSDGLNEKCSAMADEYSALVSKGIDAGVSMDDDRILAVAEQRDELRSDIKNSCA